MAIDIQLKTLELSRQPKIGKNKKKWKKTFDFVEVHCRLYGRPEEHVLYCTVCRGCGRKWLDFREVSQFFRLTQDMKVFFVHPDLGIGGAERLVVDTALALQARHHDVEVFTAHHDPGHCFEETKNGTLKVTACGDWLPRRIFGRFYALCAVLRMLYVSLYVILRREQCDIFFCDQVSACIPVLRLAARAKVLFYCHFPDLLLTKRTGFLKKLYRRPMDWLEELTTGMAHEVVVNSEFTADTYMSTFSSLRQRPRVLYPSLNFAAFDGRPGSVDHAVPPHARTVFLSINRYERKKNLPLALHALALLRERLSKSQWSSVYLVMAGGYDERVVENVQHYRELEELCTKLDLQEKVTFLRSFSNEEKVSLLSRCCALLYTPENEHFGICPLEAMYMARPVVACNSGGPRESVVHEKTGFLCKPTAECFADGMEQFLQDATLSKEMGARGKQRVIEKFSFTAFTTQVDREVCGMMGKTYSHGGFLFVRVILLGAFAVTAFVLLSMFFQ